MSIWNRFSPLLSENGIALCTKSYVIFRYQIHSNNPLLLQNLFKIRTPNQLKLDNVLQSNNIISNIAKLKQKTAYTCR